MSLVLTQENFSSEVLNAGGVVLVDFWAAWCGPCKMISPVIDELAEEYTGGSVKIGKVNVDEQPDLAQEQGITSIPTFKIFKGGKAVDEFLGAQAKEAIKERIARASALQ